jgi:7-carboxy-7-deazaguanine synthase
MSKKYRYSEVFGRTIQGEGQYTGIPTVWLRLWGCNFNCSHFGMDVDALDFDPSQPDVPALGDLDLSLYPTVEDLPVFKFGCDSSYSWSKAFMHLAQQNTGYDIANKIIDFMRNSSNPQGLFLHPKSLQPTHMAFTGGEPLMSQSAIVDVMKGFEDCENYPHFLTIETNGTQKLRSEFVQYFETFNNLYDGELFWSVSPKLYISGEKWEDAIKPEIVREYRELSDHGQLKFVCNGSDRCWDEIERATKMYRSYGIDWPVWIMPVGATSQSQEEIMARVAEGAVDRGYNVSARVHCWIFGNVVGK